MYLSIVILPLLGSIVSGFFGRKIGSQGSQIITSFGVILTTIIALILFFEVGFNGALWGRISLLCRKLSNSGEALKLMVLNLIRKYIGGWTNYSGIVTSHKMSENEIGNRGSKSIADLYKPGSHISAIVKEQRVDGSWHALAPACLRCTLTGFERNSQVKILSNQINKPWLLQGRSYTSAAQPCLTQNLTMNPWFVTGFADAESCFTLSVVRNNKMKAGWQVNQSFQITLHAKDQTLIELIQSYFGVGSINYKHGSEVIKYYVQSIKDLARVIDHFEKHPLITQKLADYELFKQALLLIQNKEHLTIEGLQKIVAIKASLNLGLSPELKAAFPEILPVQRPSVLNQRIENPNWLAGFTSGVRSGCFLPRIINSSSSRLGFRVQLLFKLTQHSRDEELMKSLMDYLGCGNVSVDGAVDYLVVKFSDLTDKVIPFFVKYPILGVKSKDFADFCKVAELMQNKAHLTAEGLNQIRQIKAGMNTGRKFEA